MPALGEPIGALLLAGMTTLVLLALGTAVVLRGLRPGGSTTHPWLIRGEWVAIVALLAIALNLLSETWTRAEPKTGASPPVVVDVQASMWRFTITPSTIPLDTPVEFRLESTDTIHGFGMYDPTGRLLFTVMAVPGSPEYARYTFTEPGIYTIRCTEYCGAPHGLMRATFTVERR
jgi:cytochrome c oxidase subunit 2